MHTIRCQSLHLPLHIHLLTSLNSPQLNISNCFLPSNWQPSVYTKNYILFTIDEVKYCQLTAIQIGNRFWYQKFVQHYVIWKIINRATTRECSYSRLTDRQTPYNRMTTTSMYRTFIYIKTELNTFLQQNTYTITKNTVFVVTSWVDLHSYGLCKQICIHYICYVRCYSDEYKVIEYANYFIFSFIRM